MRATPRVFPQGGNYVSRRIVTIRQDIVRFRDAGDSRMRAGKMQGKRKRIIFHLTVIVGHDFPHEFPSLASVPAIAK